MEVRSHAPVRWAPKVGQGGIRRLYELDALGIRDEELIEEIGCALHLRCVSILEVTEAVRGRPKCHGCGETIERRTCDPLLRCPSCGWEAEWRVYQRSYQHRQLFGGAATEIFREFTARFPGARTPREKLLLIDRLIHEFHWYSCRIEGLPAAVRPTAANLIQGDKLRDAVSFLDSITYGDRSEPETEETAARWRWHAAGPERSQQGGAGHD